MSVGANIVYGPQHRLRQLFAKSIGEKKNGLGFSVPASGKKFCRKVSATAPTNSEAGDICNEAGDIVLHFNTAGAFQAAYYVISASTPTFTKLGA